MTTYAGRPVFPPYFTDPSGNPQELVSITVYNRGTVVKPTLYTSRTKATPLANPFTADSLGNAEFYVDPGEYDALVNGVTLPFSSVPDPAESVESPDATTLVKGKVQLAGDLGGTAAAPTVPGLAAKANDNVVLKITGDQEKAGNLKLTGDKGLTFPTSLGALVHGVHRTQATFNGVVDDVLNVGLNITPGAAGVKGVANESLLQLGLEQHWFDGATKNYTEFNLDYVSPDDTHAFRPMSWYAERTAGVAPRDNGWNFRGTHWLYSSDTDDEVIRLTDAGVNIHGFRLSARTRVGAGYAYPAFQPLNTDVCRLIVMPKGNPGAGERSSITAYGSDYQADQVNWQRVLLSANSDGGADLFTEKAGTGVAGSIYMHAGRVLEFKTDGKIVMGNKLTVAGQSGGSVEVIDNSASAFYTRLNAQNSTFRLFGGSHLGILDASSTTGIDLYHDGTAASVDTFSVTPISLRINAVEHARISAGADGETALMVRRNIGGSFTLQRVSMGAADSGGAGFKVLRVPN